MKNERGKKNRNKIKCLRMNERKQRRKNENDRKRKNDILKKVALALNPKLKKTKQNKTIVIFNDYS